MSKTLTELNLTVEELEKRIKAISTSHSTLAQIIAVRDSLEQVKECLNNLNSAITTKEDSATSSELSALALRVTTAENDISSIETDLANAQDDITDINTEISAINSSIGEQNTTITNIQTAQTNLSTTQSNQASTISTNGSRITNNTNQINSLKTRVTTCENNISTLTGGVDVSAIEERLSAVEANSGYVCAHQIYNFHNACPTNKTLYTREYYFSCNSNALIYQKLKLKYTSTASGTLTIEVYEEQIATGETFTVNLSEYPSEFEIERQFLPTKKANNIMLKAVSTTEITYKYLDLWLFGTNVHLYNYDQDVKMICFNNCYYVTRYYDDCFKYGKFSSIEDIDLNNLPNTRVYHDARGYYRYAIFAPFCTCEYPYQIFNTITDNCFYFEVMDENTQIVVDSTLDLTSTIKLCRSYNNSCGGEIYPSIQHPYIIAHHIKNSIPVFEEYSIVGSRDEYRNLKRYNDKEWFFVTLVKENYKTFEGGPTSFDYTKAIALNEDGYYYLINNRSVNQVLKIAKGGDYVTAYLQTDNSINVYISNGYTVKKYILTAGTNNKYTCTYDCEITNCCYYFELVNNCVLKKTTSGWQLETLVVDSTDSSTEESN